VHEVAAFLRGHPPFDLSNAQDFTIGGF